MEDLLYLVVLLHLLVVSDEVDEPEALLLSIAVPLAEVDLELLEELVQLSHVLGDRGQGQGHEGQDQEMPECHVVSARGFKSSLGFKVILCPRFIASRC